MIHMTPAVYITPHLVMPAKHNSEVKTLATQECATHFTFATQEC